MICRIIQQKFSSSLTQFMERSVYTGLLAQRKMVNSSLHRFHENVQTGRILMVSVREETAFAGLVVHFLSFPAFRAHLNFYLKVEQLW